MSIVFRLSVDLIDEIDNNKHQVYSSVDAALKSILSILSCFFNELISTMYSLGITSEQYHSLETEKQIHPCDNYCEKVLILTLFCLVIIGDRKEIVVHRCIRLCCIDQNFAENMFKVFMDIFESF